MTLQRLLKDDGGNSAIQFALIVPTLMLLTIGIIDLGRLGYVTSTVSFAVNDAARFASLRGSGSTSPVTESQVQDYARNRAIGLTPADLDVDVDWDPNNNAGSTVTVEGSYDIELFIQAFLPLSPFEITRSSTMTIF